MGTDWGKILEMKFSRIILSLILIILIIVVAVGLFTTKPIEIWVLKFNEKDTKIIKDTISIIKYDTVYLNKKENVILKSEKMNDQTNVSSVNQKGGQTAREITNNTK